MVARTKLSPTLLVDESNRRSRNDESKSQPPSNLHRKDSFSEFSSISQSESFDSWSSSPPRAVAPAPCAARVRSRFLNRLGISPPMSSRCTSPTAAAARRPRPLSRDSQDESFQVSLKGDGEEESKAADMSFGFFRQSSSLSSSAGSQSPPASERCVSFAPAVTVHPIPKHTAYSARIRETLWTNPTEMQESAARNCLEFASENWDWRQVAEDQDMVYYHGELVHPVHVAHEYNIRRQFCAVMSAQQQQQRNIHHG